MLKVIISPAKKMKIRNDILPYKNIPFFIKEAEKLFSYMGNMSFDELKDLWKCSDKLVEENERQFRIGNLKQNLSPAILSYEGIQYKYMAPAVFEEQAFTWLEKHLRILSGFYGALSPFDGVIPYRLEMQARFHKEEIDNLYDFWGQKLADYVLKDCDCLINLASKEYSKSILKYIPENVRVITCVFGELIDGKIKEKGIEEKVTLVGNVSNVNEWYQAFDCFVLPSIWEGLPVVGVEAQAADLPCIFSASITREIGLSSRAKFVSTKNKEQWISEIKKAMEDKKRKDTSELIKNNNYDIEIEAVKLENKYIELAGETK